MAASGRDVSARALDIFQGEMSGLISRAERALQQYGDERAKAARAGGESKEATHRRFYEAFHDWFMQSNCDFWSECDAPDALASIAVEICDALAASQGSET